MLDLSSEAIKKFWQDFHDKKTYKIISFMEQIETWVLDGHPELEAKIATIAQLANNNYKLITIEDDDKNTIIHVLSYIKMSRALRILYALDASNPGIVSELVNYAENLAKQDNNPIAKAFIQRNIAFERMRIISKIFSEKRLESIIKLLGKTTV